MLVLSDLGQTVAARGSGHHQGGHSGAPSLYYGNQDLFGFGLGQTYARGSGHHQGGHSGAPSLYYGNQDLFGLGKMMPGSEGASEANEALFGFGQVDNPLVEQKTADRVRNFANFALATGAATYVFLSMRSENNQTKKVALGALGGGLAISALLSLGMTLGKIKLS